MSRSVTSADWTIYGRSENKMGGVRPPGQGRGVRLIFTGGHISLAVAFKGPNAISTP